MEHGLDARLSPVHEPGSDLTGAIHHGNITFSLLLRVPGELPILVLSHDEVVYGKRSLLSKMPGDDGRSSPISGCFLAWMYGHPGKKLLFMGSEFGQRNEWNHDVGLDWHLANSCPGTTELRRLAQHLNYVYKSEPALWAARRHL